MASQRRKGQFTLDILISLVILAFCAAGLALTLRNQYRGDKTLFMIAFIFGIAYSGLEVLIGLFGCICDAAASDFCSKRDNEQACFSVKNVFYILLSLAAFALLLAAVIIGEDNQQARRFGCQKFGCANVMAIIALILYGFRVLLLTLSCCCLFCTSTCCACCRCCLTAIAPFDQGESGERHTASS